MAGQRCRALQSSIRRSFGGLWPSMVELEGDLLKSRPAFLSFARDNLHNFAASGHANWSTPLALAPLGSLDTPAQSGLHPLTHQQTANPVCLGA